MIVALDVLSVILNRVNDCSWMTSAACRNMDTSLFFPERGQMKKFREAVAVCNGCQVKQQCFDYAMELSEQHEIIGVWAGTSAHQRRQLLREKTKNEQRNS
jgi:WhiB family redox-sensing transcriptional regulator